MNPRLLLVAAVAWAPVAARAAEEIRLGALGHAQGEMSGEITDTSAILQSRLTVPPPHAMGDIYGREGVACFEVSDEPRFGPATIRTGWIRAEPDNDFIVKVQVRNLRSDTFYYYRLLYGPNNTTYHTGDTRTFRTHPGRDASAAVSFAVVTGMNYDHLHDTRYRRHIPRESAHLGYPTFVAMLKANPDYFVGTGDNVYFDVMATDVARTPAAMRRKYHEQFVQTRLVEFFSRVGTYWMKDDHDYRFNDSDPHSPSEATALPGVHDTEPSHRLGVRLFLEQLPVADPGENNPRTYRTHRVSALLQIWFVEGRDYRSPNAMPDGPEKSIWGADQRNWLQQSLVESDAPFKVLFSATPLVGPDNANKNDNHANPLGFRHEGDAFFAWLSKAKIDPARFVIICGDRHWQYHARHPSGYEEFSSGVVDEAHSNVRGGWKAGDPDSTDPEGRIVQHYLQSNPTGGFLLMTVRPRSNGNGGQAEFAFYNDHGGRLYRVVRPIEP